MLPLQIVTQGYRRMSPFNFTHILIQAVDELSESESYKGLFHQHTDGNPLPSAKALRDIVELARAIIFPGYFGNSTIKSWQACALPTTAAATATNPATAAKKPRCLPHAS